MVRTWRACVGAAMCTLAVVTVSGCEAETDTPSAVVSYQQCVAGWNKGAIYRRDSSYFMPTRRAGLMGSRGWVGGGEVACQVAFLRANGMAIEFISAPVRESSEAYHGLEWEGVSLLPRTALRDEVGWWRACQTDAGRLELGHHCGPHDPSVKLFPYWTIHRRAP